MKESETKHTEKKRSSLPANKLQKDQLSGELTQQINMRALIFLPVTVTKFIVPLFVEKKQQFSQS